MTRSEITKLWLALVALRGGSTDTAYRLLIDLYNTADRELRTEDQTNTRLEYEEEKKIDTTLRGTEP